MNGRNPFEQPSPSAGGVPEAAKKFGDQVKEDVTNVTDFLRGVFGKAREVSERAERMVSNCQVCRDVGKVGVKGHEVDCPACRPSISVVPGVCPTCQGTGRVGHPPSQIMCPVCSPKVRGQLR